MGKTTDDLTDDVTVVRTAKTPGMVMAEGGKGVCLHNKNERCGAVSNIKNPTTLPLSEVPHRPGLKYLCPNCNWPENAEYLFKQSPERFR